MKKKATIIYFLCCWFAGGLQAHNAVCLLPAPKSNEPQSLNDVVNLALSCNPNTQVAWSQMQSADAAVGIARSTFWPQITGQYYAQEAYNEGTVITSGSTTGTDSLTPSAVISARGKALSFVDGPNLNVSYLVWDFGNRNQMLKAAKLQWLSMKYSRSEVVQQVILGVEQAYYQVLAQKELLFASQLSLKESNKNLESSLMLHQQGLATMGDVYQARSGQSQAVLQLQQTQGAYDIAKGQLNIAIGIPVEKVLTLQSMPTHIRTQGALSAIDKKLQYAEHHRPDLLAAKAQVVENEAIYKAHIAQALPNMQFNFNIGENLPRNTRGNGVYGNALLTLNVPIFTGFALKYGIRMAKANLDVAKEQEASLATQVELQVWQAYFNLKTDVQALSTSAVYLRSSEQAARQAKGQYREGLGNILSVLTTQATVANARAQMIQAKLNWYVAIVQLAQAMGDLQNGYPRGVQESSFTERDLGGEYTEP